MSTAKKVVEYDIIRVLALLLVVVGHCDFIKSHGVDVSNIISENLITYEMFEDNVRAWIYSFHMPLFIMMSGAMYAIVRSKYTNFEYIKNRFKRLIVPYLVCGTLFAFPIKYISGYFIGDSIIKAYIKSVLTASMPGHLWFLWVLFVVSILMCACLDSFAYRKMGGGTFLLIFLIVNIVSPKGEYYFQIYRILEYPFYYLLGYYFEGTGVRSRLFNISKSRKAALAATLFAASILLIIASNNLLITNRLICNCYSIVQAITGTMFIFVVSSLVADNWTRKTVLKKLLDNSFSIYLYHEPLQFALLYVFATLGLLQCFNNETGYMLLIIVRLIVGIVVPVYIGRIVDICTRSFRVSQISNLDSPFWHGE